MNIIAKDVYSFEQIVNDFIKNLKISGLNELGNWLTAIDQALFEKRESHLHVVKFKWRTIQTTIGMLRFKRRYYYDDYENCYLYLLDAFLNIPKRNRYMNSVKIKLLEAASEMSYEKAGRYGCEDNLPASKSTVCRIIKNTDFYIVANNKISQNDDKIHLQIDEKFVSVKGCENKVKYYTATIFKGISSKGKKNILLNRTLISDSNLTRFFKRINHKLVKKYLVSLETEIYLSGDLATYIQNAPERIVVCKAKYVPDKYHIKHSLESELELKPKDSDLNDSEFLASLVKLLREKNTPESKKILKYIKSKALPFEQYEVSDYLGCSQEGMNSHYYASRFDKVPNNWKMKTILKLSKIIEARLNKDQIKLGFADEFYPMPYELEHESILNSLHRDVINTDGMPYTMKKFFTNLCNDHI